MPDPRPHGAQSPNLHRSERAPARYALAVAAACSTPEEALSVAESGRFDIIVSDIGLPRIDGYELIARLREVPALALTGYAERMAQLTRRGPERERE